MLTHDAWLHAGAAVGRLAVVQPDDLGLLFLPLAHAFAKLCVVAWIETGGRLALSESAERLVADAAEVRPTFLPAPPRVYEKVFGAVVSKGLAERGLRGRLFRLAMRGFDRWSAARDRGEDRRDLAFLLARRLVLPEVGRALRARLGGRVRFLVSGSAPLSPRISRFFDEAGLPILEGYAMTECASAATVTRPGRVRHGSVGEALPGVEIRIADDGEVLLRGPTLMAGYWHDPEATLEALRDGWLHTGDLGALDEDGFLRITDRKKDVFKTSGGKMVAPQLLEREVKAAEPLVSQVLVHGHGRRFVSALLTLDPAAVRRWAAESGLAITEPLGEDPNVRERIGRSIEAVNRELPRFATVKRFAILPGELGAGCGELTPTMKLRRRAVEERYRAVLDSLYEP